MSPLEAACPSTCPRLPDQPGLTVRHRFLDANGLRFHLVEAGAGPLVLLLHGFPEFWYGWRRQIGALAQHVRVVAPDLRGYNLTEKPASGDGGSPYGYETLISDVPALIHALGESRAHVVGHDWGGLLAWGTAMRHPEVVDRLAVLNAPHPAAYLRELTHNPRQMLKSWYAGFFQIPGLPEWLLTVGHGRGVSRMLRGSAIAPDTFSQTELAAYRRAVLRPGAARAMLAWYRALGREGSWELAVQPHVVTTPTLLIWGLRDVALVSGLTEGLAEWVPSLRVERLANASHWVQHERTAVVNRLLLEHFLEAGS